MSLPLVGYSTLVDDLLSGDGPNGSAWTVSIVVVALSLGGLLERTGTLAAPTEGIEGFIRGVAGLTISTGASAFAMNGLAGQQYTNTVIPAMAFGGSTHPQLGDSRDRPTV